MARTALEMSREEWSTYQPQRERAIRPRANARRKKALKVAGQAADMLRRDFHATRVVAFGSVTRAESFTEWSDIDLAAWGIPAERFYAAVGAVTGLSEDFEIDLIDIEMCNPIVRQAAENSGIDVW